MNNQSIEEASWQIGLFMELREIKLLSGKPAFEINGNFYQSKHLKYHSSWDWLMPVVEKIEAMQTEFDGYFGVHICSNGCTIAGTRLNTTTENPHYAYFNDIIHESKILATWYCVVQFIQWYKENNKNGK